MVVVAMHTSPSGDRGSSSAFIRVAGLTLFNGRDKDVSATDTLPRAHGSAILGGGCVMAFDTTSLGVPAVREFRVGQPPVRYIGIADAPVDNRFVLFRTLLAIEGVA